MHCDRRSTAWLSVVPVGWGTVVFSCHWTVCCHCAWSIWKDPQKSTCIGGSYSCEMWCCWLADWRRSRATECRVDWLRYPSTVDRWNSFCAHFSPMHRSWIDYETLWSSVRWHFLRHFVARSWPVSRSRRWKNSACHLYNCPFHALSSQRWDGDRISAIALHWCAVRRGLRANRNELSVHFVALNRSTLLLTGIFQFHCFRFHLILSTGCLRPDSVPFSFQHTSCHIFISHKTVNSVVR